ncbi:uncharacterized protein TNCV_1573991 [Trichonephila clavipes]|nr:uncharacterized protein TNCV_1573991 [Trichonephila clavipes]
MASKSEKALLGRKFAIKLSEDLALWLKKRINVSNLPQPTRRIICELSKVEQSVEQLETKNREICAFCPCKLRRMTRTFYLSCSTAMCGEHYAKMRKDCFENK